MMLDAKDIVVWINDDAKEVMVTTSECGRPGKGRGYGPDRWCDPIERPIRNGGT
jgi:hypothetical protein